MSNYQITSRDGNQVIDAGTDIEQARVAAQSYANRWQACAYLAERGAAEEDFEFFAPDETR